MVIIKLQNSNISLLNIKAIYWRYQELKPKLTFLRWLKYLKKKKKEKRKSSNLFKQIQVDYYRWIEEHPTLSNMSAIWLANTLLKFCSEFTFVIIEMCTTCIRPFLIDFYQEIIFPPSI